MLTKIIDLYCIINEGQVHQRVPSSRDCIQDQDSWTSCWSFEDYLNSISSKLSKGTGGKIITQDEKTKIIRVIRKILNIAFHYFDEHNKQKTIQTNYHDNTNVNQFNIIKFKVSKDKIALHNPLIKLLAMFLDRAINVHQIPLFELINGMEEQFALFIPEYSLRLQVLPAQVAAKMWVRNGVQFGFLVQIQRHSYYYTHVPKDIFLIQLGAVSMLSNHQSASTFYQYLLDRYEIDKLFYFHPNQAVIHSTEWDNSQYITVLEHFLELIAILITNRTKTGELSNIDKIRYFIIQSLLLKPLTHSELLKKLLDEHKKHPQLKQIIASVADFDSSPMIRGEPGRYIIRSEFWKFIDPYFLHFSLTEFQEFQENYFHHLSKTSPQSKSKIIPVCFPSCPSENFNGLLDLLQCKLLHGILYWNLFNACEYDQLSNLSWSPISSSSSSTKSTNTTSHCRTGIFSSVTCTHHALRLLFLACSDRLHRTKQFQVPPSYDVISNEKITISDATCIPFVFDDIAINILQEFVVLQLPTSKQKYSLLSLLIHLYHTQDSIQEYCESILQLLREISPLISNQIDSLHENYNTNHHNHSSSDSSNQNDKDLIAKKQKAILDKFAKQRELFASGEHFIDMDDELMDDDDNLICAVCKEICVPSLESPIGLVGYQQKGKLIQRHRALLHGEELPPVQYDHVNQANLGPLLVLNQGRLQYAGFRMHRAAAAAAAAAQNSSDDSNNEEQESLTIPNCIWREIISPNNTFCTQFCQHAMHVNCYQKYHETLNPNRLQFSDFEGTYNCPLCRAYSNVLVPIPPNDFHTLNENSTSSTNRDNNKQKENEKMEDCTEDEDSISLMEEDQENGDDVSSTHNTPSSDLDLSKLKNVYDTLAMNCSLIYNLEEPKYYISFHIANDIHFISGLRSKIELLELSSRKNNPIIPPISILAENRPFIQQYYSSLLGYKTCCLSDKNYDKNELDRMISSLHFMVFNKPPVNSSVLLLPDCDNYTKLLSCDLFSILISLIFYHGNQRIQMEQFDDFVHVLFIAQILQILYHYHPGDCVDNTCEYSITNESISFAYFHEILLIIKNSNVLSLHDNHLHDVQGFIYNRCLEFIRKVYILRHTLFDVFFSNLPDENSKSPFSDLCETLIKNSSSRNLENLISHWSSTTNSIREVAFFAPFNFTNLPRQFSSFAHDKKYSAFICQNCGKKPKNPALCLFCGIIVCSKARCCPSEGNQHVRECTDYGVYLLLHSTMVLLLRNGKGCVWDSIYTDEHGEIDQNLTRGKELYLNEIKLKELYDLCINHKFDSVCYKKISDRQSAFLNFVNF